MHTVVSEGVFTESSHFVHISETWKHRAIEIWQDKIFELLLNEKKIDQETVAGMRTWRHSGFSVDNSFVEDDTTIQKILKHCGKWKESIPRPPPQLNAGTAIVARRSYFGL